MKTASYILFFLLSFFTLSSLAYAQGEAIKSFDTVLTVKKDGSVVVTETIKYYFPTERHGIYRDILVSFTNQDGEKLETPLQVESVTDSYGNPYKYSVSREDDAVSIKIGDANRFVSGDVIYKITYNVKGAVEGFSDHDEVYWNVTGGGWDVPIMRASATVILPPEVAYDSLKISCFTGVSGSTLSQCTSSLQPQGTGGENTVVFETLKALSAGSQLTVTVSFAKGVVTPGGKISANSWSWKKMLPLILWYVIIPSLVFVFYFLFGRDPKINSAVPVLFEPPKDGLRTLSPAEAGTILDESADNEDITATIVDLAIRGFLKITEVKDEGFGKVLNSMIPGLAEKKYLLTKVKEFKDVPELRIHEKELLEGLFGNADQVFTNELKNKFHDSSNKIKNSLYEGVVSNGFFPSNPNKIRNAWYIIAYLAMFTANIPFAIVAALMGRAMPRKTLKGSRARMETLGLKRFLTSQDRQLEFQEANWYLFEKLLPYAIALKVTETWAKRFQSLGSLPENLAWYSGSGNFNPQVFASSINSLNSSVSDFSTPTRSGSGFSSGFGGGGFSGGGFGGGGGGRSW